MPQRHEFYVFNMKEWWCCLTFGNVWQLGWDYEWATKNPSTRCPRHDGPRRMDDKMHYKYVHSLLFWIHQNTEPEIHIPDEFWIIQWIQKWSGKRFIDGILRLLHTTYMMLNKVIVDPFTWLKNLNAVQPLRYKRKTFHMRFILIFGAVPFFPVASIHCSVFSVQRSAFSGNMNTLRMTELYGVCITLLSDDWISIVFAIVSRDPFIYLQFHNIIMFRSNIHFNGRYINCSVFFTRYPHENNKYCVSYFICPSSSCCRFIDRFIECILRGQKNIYTGASFIPVHSLFTKKVDEKIPIWIKWAICF